MESSVLRRRALTACTATVAVGPLALASYRCLQPHQAQPGWTPPNVPALWQRV